MLTGLLFEVYNELLEVNDRILGTSLEFCWGSSTETWWIQDY